MDDFALITFVLAGDGVFLALAVLSLVAADEGAGVAAVFTDLSVEAPAAPVYDAGLRITMLLPGWPTAAAGDLVGFFTCTTGGVNAVVLVTALPSPLVERVRRFMVRLRVLGPSPSPLADSIRSIGA